MIAINIILILVSLHFLFVFCYDRVKGNFVFLAGASVFTVSLVQLILAYFFNLPVLSTRVFLVPNLTYGDAAIADCIFGLCIGGILMTIYWAFKAYNDRKGV